MLPPFKYELEQVAKNAQRGRPRFKRIRGKGNSASSGGAILRNRTRRAPSVVDDALAAFDSAAF